MDSERAKFVDASCSCLNVRLSITDGDAPGGTQEFGNAAVQPRGDQTQFFARSTRVSRAENIVAVFPQMTELRAAQHGGEGYQIFSCKCCNKELFATAGATSGAGHVAYVNFDCLLIGAAKINAVTLSPGYSKAFKIVVPSTPDADDQPSTDDNEDFADSLRQRHEVWLKEEEVRMATRIEVFKRRELEAFAKLQEKETSDELQLYQYFQSLSTPVASTSAAELGATSIPTAATPGHGATPAVTQQPDEEDEDAQQSDDDTMFAFEGFSNSWEQKPADPISDDDDDGVGRVGAGVRARAPAGIADTILGSSLQNGSLPIDIPTNASPGKSLLAGSMTRQEQIGSFSGSLVGSLREMSMRSRNEALKRRTSGESDLGTSPSP